MIGREICGRKQARHRRAASADSDVPRESKRVRFSFFGLTSSGKLNTFVDEERALSVDEK